MGLFDFLTFRKGNSVINNLSEFNKDEKASRASEPMDEDSSYVGSGSSYGAIAGLPHGHTDLPYVPDEPYDQLLLKYTKSIWVYIAVNTIATALSQVSFRVIDVRKKGQPDEAVGGTGMGLLTLLQTPNDWFSYVEFTELLGMHLLLTGNAYIEKAALDAKGRPTELFLLNPKNMIVVPHKKDFVQGYIYKVNRKEVYFKPEEIIHIKLPDPRGESHYGLSPLAAARSIIDQDLQAINWNSAYFKNATWPSGIITCKDGLNKDEFKRAKQELKQNYEGSSKAGKVLILSGGMEWKQTTPNPKDLDFINLRKMSREEILNLFRIPPSIAGIFQFENSTSRSAGVREQHIQFWSQTIQPLANKIITKLNDELVSDFSPNYQIVPDVSNIPALKETDEMKKIRAETAAMLVRDVGWSPNMVNTELYPDKPKIPWGDSPSPAYNSFSGNFANLEAGGLTLEDLEPEDPADDMDEEDDSSDDTASSSSDSNDDSEE